MTSGEPPRFDGPENEREEPHDANLHGAHFFGIGEPTTVSRRVELLPDGKLRVIDSWAQTFDANSDPLGEPRREHVVDPGGALDGVPYEDLKKRAGERAWRHEL